MKPFFHTFILLLIACTGCKKHTQTTTCKETGFKNAFTARNFSMGFTTWPFGGDYADREFTYSFIADHADIYSEQFDHFIPWKALINRQPLPATLTNDIASRIALKPAGHQVLLSVSLLNIPRTDLLADEDGFIPAYVSMDDSVIVNAYTTYLAYLLDRFHPGYLVLAMEVNELKIKQANKWTGYVSLIQLVKSRLKANFPAIKMAESVTLHNWYHPVTSNPEEFVADITAYVNQQDFAAISFYPFLKGMHTAGEFQQAFDFLHDHTNKPVAFVETGHLAENLSVPAFQWSVNGDVCEQKAYLETLLVNASTRNYAFVIWWTHRDYDKLWQLFPPETKDIGLLWRDTGLLDENGHQRPAFTSWTFALSK